jgi:hypothetical protein
MLVLLLPVGIPLVNANLYRLLADGAYRAETLEASALSEAKLAIIGYAASYPDQHDARYGPGYLPCPDIDGDGSPDPACGVEAVGWLPWRRLGLDHGGDSLGHNFFYRVAPLLRANPYKATPINVDALATVHDLVLDDVAATIWSAHAAPATQRLRDPEPVPDFRRAWARVSNAVAICRAATTVVARRRHPCTWSGRTDELSSTGSVHWRAVSFRDVLEAAGWRALRAAVNATERFLEAAWNDRQYPPWLLRAPADGENTPTFLNSSLSYGFLPVHRPEGSFRTGFELQWSGLRPTRSMTPVPSDGRVVIPQGAGLCHWHDAQTVDCQGTVEQPTGSGGRERWDIDVRYRSSLPVEIAGPSPTDLRRRGVVATSDTVAMGLSSIRMTRFTPAERNEPEANVIETAEVELHNAQFTRLRTSGIRYLLDPSQELPEWFVRNAWHELILGSIALPMAESSGPLGECSFCPTNDLTLLTHYPHGRQKSERLRGLLILGGERLPFQNSPPLGFEDWLEASNARPSLRTFVRRTGDRSVNDLILSLRTPAS